MECSIVTDKDFLHQKSEKINAYDKKVLKNLKPLIWNLQDTLRASSNGIGLAAPQIGELVRVFISSRNDYPYKKQVAISPAITIYHGASELLTEGCLSCPEQDVDNIPRYKRITASWHDEDGEFHIEVLKDMEAIIFQHELDHLNGILITDYLE